MPRPNPPRSLQSEADLARRIAYEREQRGWTYEGIAKRLTDAGCPIQGSAIYKIEKGTPRRRISVDELVAFADVFGVGVVELLIAPEIIAQSKAQELIADLERARDVVVTSMTYFYAEAAHIDQLARALADDEHGNRVRKRIQAAINSILKRLNDSVKMEQDALFALALHAASEPLTTQEASGGQHPETA